MGHKIFISYKYADTSVKSLGYNKNTVRDYVNVLQTYIEDYSEHIYKAEEDDEDLSQFTDDTIWEKLKDRIFDSTLTIVLISPNMKESWNSERNQWIPWEISYSLKEESRKTISGTYKSSACNALLAIVLPDSYGNYTYYIDDNNCCASSCRTLKTDQLFTILKKNMFNIKKPDKYTCDSGSVIYHGESSYIYSVKWKDFIANPEKYIDKAYDIQSAIEKYDIKYEIN